jgi:hypothetical protein
VLGNQLGKFISMDAWYPGYLRVRVALPLNKQLVPMLNLRIKGRGQMSIMLRYENIPHFCFMCGRIGHAALNCDDEDVGDGGIRFGEEVRASPPKRVWEIKVSNLAPKAMTSLFQAGVDISKPVSAGSKVESASRNTLADKDNQTRA